LPTAFNDLEDIAALEKWTSQDWATLLDKRVALRNCSTCSDDRYFVSAPSINMIGKPSAALAAKIESDEKSRIAKRKEELGEEKLKELEKRMQDAKKESEIEPPAEMISEFPITDVSVDIMTAYVADRAAI
jgi:Zn-dependent M16 (insulinase) family peptidase